MKYIIKLSALVFTFLFGYNTHVAAQNNDCVQCEGNQVSGSNASTVGKNNTASGNNSFAGGYNTTASGSNSFAFGYGSTATQSTNIAIGNTAQATGIGAIAIGSYVKASAQNSYAIGSGTTSNYPLTNNTANSIAFGVNSKKPTVLITKALNNNYTGKVAIGPTNSPQAKLHIKSDSNEDASVYIEPSNKTSTKAFLYLYDTNHKLTVDQTGTLELNSGPGLISLKGDHYSFGDNLQAKTRIYTNDTPGIYHNVKRDKKKEIRDVDAPSYGIDFLNGGMLFRTAIGKPERGSEITNWKEALYLCTDGRIGIGSKSTYLENKEDHTLKIVSPEDIHLNSPNLQFSSSDMDFNTTNAKFHISNLDLNSEKTRIQSSDMDLSSEIITLQSPEMNLQAEDIQFQSTNMDLNTSQTELHSNIIGIDSDHIGIDSEDIDINSGNIAIQSTNIGLNSSNITLNGKIGINTTNDVQDYALAVDGGIISTKVFVKNVSQWPDHVFTEEYPLMELSQLRHYLNENKHLPGIPSEDEIILKGYDLHDMQYRMMEKIEEMTRYILILQEEIDSLKSTPQASTRVNFTYDETGNRTSRSIAFEKIQEPEIRANHSNGQMYELYPNPTPGQFTVFVKSGEAAITHHTTIHSSTGVLIEERTIQEGNNTFDLSSYANGIYILSIETSDGLQSWKVIKQ